MFEGVGKGRRWGQGFISWEFAFTKRGASIEERGVKFDRKFIVLLLLFFYLFLFVMAFLCWVGQELPSIQNLPIVTKRHTINSHRSKLFNTLPPPLSFCLHSTFRYSNSQMESHFSIIFNLKHKPSTLLTTTANNILVKKKKTIEKNWCFVGFI